jgi:Protein of unknown function (DUF1569)
MKNIFNSADATQLIERINQLKSGSPALWGKMNAGKMLAHCNVSFEMVYENIHEKPNFFVRFLLKMFVKNAVVNDKPYSQNGGTAPAMVIKEDKNFEVEKIRLTNYIIKTQELGETHFDGKEYINFGVLSKTEWNNLFVKHLDHHLRQFGV